MSSTPLISLCAIFKDEERFLPEFVDLFKDSCDELILVDTGSSDNSLNILTEKQVEPVHFPWVDDFSAARNFAISMATGKWILTLDIDERIFPEDMLRLRALLQSHDFKAFSPTCISLRDFNWRTPKPRIHSINRSMFVRVFPNHPEIRFEKPIHESIAPSLERLGVSTISIEIPVYHLGYAGELYQQKVIRNKNLLEDAIKSGSPDPTLVYYYVQTNWNSDQKTFELLKNSALEATGKLRQYLVEFCLAWLMEFPIEQSPKPVDSLSYWEEELARIDKESPMFWLKKARLAWVNHQQSEALFWYEKVRDLVTEMVSIQYFRPEILYNLGFLYACVSQYEKALETYEEFTDLFGTDPHVFHQTIKLYAITGQLEEILKSAKSPPEDLYKLQPEKKIELSKILEHVVKPTDAEACSLCINLLEKG